MQEIEPVCIVIVNPSVEIMSPLDGIVERLELAGRVCYKSEDKITPGSADRFVRKICRNHHESVLEHASVTAKFTCSRSCSHQLVRHRIASYSQESMRFCNYGKRGLQVICPPSVGIAAGSYTGKVMPFSWLETVATCYREYLQELKDGVLPEDAREVLPHATKTEVVATMNLRQWRHVFQERVSKAAQWQIRSLMNSLLLELTKELPAVFDDLTPWKEEE